MNEILVSGNVDKDFKRLGINAKLTYGNEDTDYKVYEVTEEDFKVLCDEPDIEETWEDCGWRHCVGSTKGTVNNILIVNGKELKCWYEDFEEEDLIEEEEDDFKPTYEDLLTYLCEECGATTFKNVCAIVTDLAKYNKMKMSELFKVYEGE